MRQGIPWLIHARLVLQPTHQRYHQMSIHWHSSTINISTDLSSPIIITIDRSLITNHQYLSIYDHRLPKFTAESRLDIASTSSMIINIIDNVHSMCNNDIAIDNSAHTGTVNTSSQSAQRTQLANQTTSQQSMYRHRSSPATSQQ